MKTFIYKYSEKETVVKKTIWISVLFGKIPEVFEFLKNGLSRSVKPQVIYLSNVVVHKGQTKALYHFGFKEMNYLS